MLSWTSEIQRDEGEGERLEHKIDCDCILIPIFLLQFSRYYSLNLLMETVSELLVRNNHG